MNSKTRDALRSALFEATFVVFGVVLALGANEWRQIRADQDLAEQALASIIEELVGNREALASSVEYHEGLIGLLSEEHEAGWAPEPRQFPRGFVSPARTARTAWESASETGALAKTEFPVVVELSGVYAVLDRYEAQARSIGELIYAELFSGGTDAIMRKHENLKSMIVALNYRERELLARFDATLASLGQAG